MSDLLLVECPPDLRRRFTLDVDLEEHLLGGADHDPLALLTVDDRLHCREKYTRC